MNSGTSAGTQWENLETQWRVRDANWDET